MGKKSKFLKKNPRQGDLFKGTVFERGPDVDPVQVYRDNLAVVGFEGLISLEVVNKSTGKVAKIDLKKDSIKAMLEYLHILKKG